MLDGDYEETSYWCLVDLVAYIPSSLMRTLEENVSSLLENAVLERWVRSSDSGGGTPPERRKKKKGTACKKHGFSSNVGTIIEEDERMVDKADNPSSSTSHHKYNLRRH